MQEDGISGTKSGDEPVTISAPPAAAVTIDPQNPLPEPSFMWRRWLAYLVVIVTLALTWHAAEALHDLGASEHLLTLSKWSIGFASLIATFYYVAPSAAELATIIQSSKITQGAMALAGSAHREDARASNTPQNRPDLGQGRPIRRSPAPESQIPGSTLSGAPSGPSVDLPESEEEDAAPRGRA